MMQGHELKALRKGMNLRQASLAQALGITPQFVGMMERGEKPIEPRTALSVLYLVDHPEARPDIKIGDIRPRNLGDMVQSLADMPGLTDGRIWGRWRFNAESLTLDLDSEEVVMERDDEGNDVMGRIEKYSVPLCELTNKATALDWIGQISGKAWGTITLGHFVEAIDDIFDLQGRFVYGKGFGGTNEATAYLRDRVERDTRRLSLRA